MTPKSKPHKREAEDGARPLLSYQETADHLGISLAGLKRMVASGTFPHVRIGQRVLFDPADIEAWVKDRKAGV